MYSIIDVIKDLVTCKLRFVTRDERITREQMCNTCEVRNPKTNTCTACGCWLPAKVRLKKSTCPLEIW